MVQGERPGGASYENIHSLFQQLLPLYKSQRFSSVLVSKLQHDGTKHEQPYPVTNQTCSKEMCFSLRGLELCLVRPHMLCRPNTPNPPTCSQKFSTEHALGHKQECSLSVFPLHSLFPRFVCARAHNTRFIYLPPFIIFFHFFPPSFSSIFSPFSLGLDCFSTVTHRKLSTFTFTTSVVLWSPASALALTLFCLLSASQKELRKIARGVRSLPQTTGYF